MSKKYIIHIAFLLCSFSSIISSSLFLGDLTAPDADNNGFSFGLLNKLGKCKYQETIYIASGTDLAAKTTDIKNYALSAAFSGETSCRGIASEKATINGLADQANPLHGAQFSLLNMAGDYPVVMVNGDTSLYYITSSPLASNQTIFKTTGLPSDSQGDETVFLQTTDQNSIQGAGNIVIATVRPHNGQFGMIGSGIGLFRKTDAGLVQQKAIPNNDTVRAISVDTTSTVFKITNDLDSLQENKANLYWSDKLYRLFAGVQATAGGGMNDGCKSVAVGKLIDDGTNATLKLYSICPDAAIDAETKIIGSTGAGKQAFIYKQSVMYTSSGLTYLVLVGDSENPANNNNVQKSCYALPLVDESVDPAKISTWKTSETHATLAKKDSLPTTFYKLNKNNVPVVSGRGFQTAATVAADLYDRNDLAALVGQSDVVGLNAGLITEVEVYNDTVFVLMSGGNERPGIFYSQAIFDEHGVIKSWTAWQRVTFTQSLLKDFTYMPSQGSTFHLEAANGPTKSVTLSKWSTGSKDGLLGGTLTDESVGLTDLLKTEFPQENGGIFGLFDFPATFSTDFFTQAPDTAMMIATGHQKIALILTYASNNVGDLPVIGDFKNNTLHFTEGAINPEIIAPFTNVAAFISGGALDDLEAITSATIITDIGNGFRYIVAGGTGGVAVLRNTGTQEGFGGLLAPGFQGLGADLEFEVISDFTNVKKLWTNVIGNDQYLFILTLDGLYRIDVAELSNAVPAVVTLATLDTIPTLSLQSYDFFTDVIVSDKLCLLGTNKGLVRNGNATNICTAADATAADWTSLELPAPYQNVTQLCPLLTTPLSYEFATLNVGQVYVLTHSDTFNTSVLHRLSIADISAAAIDNDTCIIENKETVKDLKTPFMSLGGLRNSMGTTGALTVTTSLVTPNQGAQLFSIPTNTYTLTRTTENYPFTEIKLSLANDKETIRGLVRQSALGTWIAYGNFGIRVCE